MQTATLHSTETRSLATFPNAAKLANWEVKFPPLALETRPAVDTAAAAYYLSRKPQTLRTWACLENGPLRPIRICGRLAWPPAEIRRLL